MEKGEIHEGENLRSITKLLEVKQDALAARIGFSQQKVSNDMNQKILEKERAVYANALGVDEKLLSTNWFQKKYQQFKNQIKTYKSKGIIK